MCVYFIQTGSSSRGSTPSSASSIGQLKQRLSTLTTAMATLTDEKSKMKINFQNDKKSMLVGTQTLRMHIGFETRLHLSNSSC